MVRHIPKCPLKLSQLSTPAIEGHYKPICDLLLSQTRSRSLPKGLQIHAHLIKSGLHSVPLVSHSLINFYSKTNLPCHARQLFHETTLRSSTTWSSLISCFAQNDLPLAALLYFRRMLAEGLKPDDHIYPSATKAAALLGRADLGGSVHALAAKTGFASDVFVGSSVVDMYCKCGEMGGARRVFDEMPSRNVVTWSGMISGYVQDGDHLEALRLFKRCRAERVEANDFTLSSVVRGCANSALLELGRQLHALCFKADLDSSPFVGTSLVSLYSRCGLVEESRRVFLESPDKNLGLRNAMLLAYAQHARAREALAAFEDMRHLGGTSAPNLVTFLGVLYACSHAGMVVEGRRCLEAMREMGLEPRAQHHACFVDMLARAGRLREALAAAEEMPMGPTECVWGSLLAGCRAHGDAELASSVADRVSDWGAVGPGLHVLLANAYASAGRWEEAARVRKALRDGGGRKETGLSWVEDGSRVHSFVSGDRTHERAPEIYAKLEELLEEMVKAGYVAGPALKRVGGGGVEEEGERVKYHSERLAVAFGLIRFSGERPIRVMKNLRVCGDCHNAIKFMSKCSGRVIILRDYSRFHRFEDGNCTCGDHW